MRYDNTSYAQISGLPICLPLSEPLGLVANLVMDDLEDSISLKIKQLQIPFHRRYIDDIIMAMIKLTLDLFNSLNQNPQFTVEMEINNNKFFEIQIIL